MILDAIKILIDEPEKLTRVILFVVKSTLSLIVTTFLYHSYINTYELIDIVNYKEWVEFIVSGRMLISLLLYLLVYFLLFEVFQPLSTGLLWLLTRIPKMLSKPDKEFEKLVFKFLQRLEYIVIDDEEKVIRGGKKIDEFYLFVKDVSSKDFQAGLVSIRDSLAINIWHLFVVFSFTYLTLLQDKFEGIFIKVTLVIVFIVLPLVLFFLNQFVKFLERDSKKILFEIKGFILLNTVIETLRKIYIFPYEPENPRKPEFHLRFSYEKQEYLLKFLYGKSLVSEYSVDGLGEILELEKAHKFLLVSNREFSRKALEICKDMDNVITIISFKSPKDLIRKLKGHFIR